MSEVPWKAKPFSELEPELLIVVDLAVIADGISAIRSAHGLVAVSVRSMMESLRWPRASSTVDPRTVLHHQARRNKGIPHAQACSGKFFRTSSVPDTGYTTHFQIRMIDESESMKSTFPSLDP